MFRQINDNKPRTRHYALEFPDGQIWVVMREGQQATVLQLTKSKALDEKATLRAALPIAPFILGDVAG